MIEQIYGTPEKSGNTIMKELMKTCQIGTNLYNNSVIADTEISLHMLQFVTKDHDFYTKFGFGPIRDGRPQRENYHKAMHDLQNLKVTDVCQELINVSQLYRNLKLPLALQSDNMENILQELVNYLKSSDQELLGDCFRHLATENLILFNTMILDRYPYNYSQTPNQPFYSSFIHISNIFIDTETKYSLFSWSHLIEWTNFRRYELVEVILS